LVYTKTRQTYGAPTLGAFQNLHNGWDIQQGLRLLQAYPEIFTNYHPQRWWVKERMYFGEMAATYMPYAPSAWQGHHVVVPCPATI